MIRTITAVVVAATFMATMAGNSLAKNNREVAAQHQLKRYYHAEGYIRAIGRVAFRTIYSSNPTIRYNWRRTVHRLVRIRDNAQHKLYLIRHPYAELLPAHLRGWLCIHNGPYPGAPHEGTGYNGPYTGPLQMSHYWQSYPVYDWNSLPPMTVYRDAEHVAAAHGFDPAWMRGQWPKTYPVCAQYF